MIADQDKSTSLKLRDITGGLITIKVGDGPSSQTFHVHKSVIVSSVLLAAIEPRCSQHDHGHVNLPKARPDVFQIYMRWMYQGESSLECLLDPVGSEPCEKGDFLLARSYVLGEMLQDDAFQDGIIKIFIKDSGYSDTSPKEVNIIYRGTPVGSPGRKLMVDLFAWGDEGYFTQGPEKKLIPGEMRAEFLEDLVRELLKRRGVKGQAPWHKTPEIYFKQKCLG